MTPDLNGLLLVISGPSGVGKSTISRAVAERLDAVFNVSMTTRPQSPIETNGVDYIFVSPEEFQKAIDQDELLEWAKVFGHRYGTPRGPVEQHIREGRIVLLEIDVQGAAQVREKFPGALMIFILPPGKVKLLERLRGRGRDDEQVIQQRYAEAQREIHAAEASGVYDHFLVNDDLSTAIERAIEIIEDRRQPS